MSTSGRSSQCQECAAVFDCSSFGPLPKLCPKCKGAPAESTRVPAIPRGTRKKKAAANSPAIATAILEIQAEIETLEQQIGTRRVALKALEAVA